jgi:hypothetical protein
MTKNIDEIKRIVIPIAQSHGVGRLCLFGSRAKGTDNPESDYDFVISKGDIKGFISYMSFINALEDALGTHVDVVTDTSEDVDFLNAIKKDEILLYERS